MGVCVVCGMCRRVVCVCVHRCVVCVGVWYVCGVWYGVGVWCV